MDYNELRSKYFVLFHAYISIFKYQIVDHQQNVYIEMCLETKLYIV